MQLGVQGGVSQWVGFSSAMKIFTITSMHFQATGFWTYFTSSFEQTRRPYTGIYTGLYWTTNA